jgi:hypothetical protein
MADERFIENSVDQFAVVTPAIGLAADFGSFRGRELAHDGRLIPANLCGKSQSGLAE